MSPNVIEGVLSTHDPEVRRLAIPMMKEAYEELKKNKTPENSILRRRLNRFLKENVHAR